MRHNRPLALAAVLALVAVQLSAQLDTSARADYATACAADHGALWGRPACLPADSVAAVPLPPSADRFTRLATLVTASFRRVQPALGLTAPDPAVGYLDSADARRWMRLELRALAAAVSARGPASRDAAHDALLFRAMRLAHYRGADTLEAALEMQDGLAAYTGARLALAALNLPDARVAQEVTDYAGRGSYGADFAQVTGPALGILLDRYASDWRTRVRTERDPGALLAKALGFRADDGLEGSARAAARAYGGVELTRAP